jgi:Fe-S cluster biosynthesis and repair protein YggX
MKTVHCIKLGKESEAMEFPPLPGAMGQRIFEHVSKEAWQAWLKYQTMLINENRLNLAEKSARDYLSRQMESYFFGDGADKISGYVEPEN